jgi:hypothetical protein
MISISFEHGDNMAEWLRRQPAKLMGYARVGSNPTVVVLSFLTGTQSVFRLYYAPKGWMQPTGFEPVPLTRLAPKASALTTRPKLLLLPTLRYRSSHTDSNSTPHSIVRDSHSLLREKEDGLNAYCRSPDARMLYAHTQASVSLNCSDINF